MTWLKRIAAHNPAAFSFLITALVLVSYVAAGIFAEIFSSNSVEQNLLAALGRGAGAIGFAFIIFRFGWQDDSGLSRFGSLAAWIAGLSILAYEIVTHVVPLMDGANLGSVFSPDSASVALNALATGPLEEIPFRGIILYAFVRLWANKDQGLAKSAIVSSLFFGASHLIHILLGRPLPQATFISVNAFLAGIYYAAIVIRWRTLWPGIAIHGVLNAIVGIVAFSTPGFEEPAGILALAAILQLPIAILGLYLIMKIKPEEAAVRAV